MTKREKKVLVSLSMAEWTAIFQAAQARGLSFAAFMRQAALETVNATPPQRKEV